MSLEERENREGRRELYDGEKKEENDGFFFFIKRNLNGIN